MKVPIYESPRKDNNPMGYLRAGARVARSVEPVSREGCPEGWYAIRPVGFVCAGELATTKMSHPVARAIKIEPKLEWPMPYRYAFVRAIAPNYLRIPSKKQQFQYEMRLERHLRNWKKLHEKWDFLEVGANDVPLDEKGHAVGKIPEHAKALDYSRRFGGDGHDEVPWWLNGGRRIPNLSKFSCAHLCRYRQSHQTPRRGGADRYLRRRREGSKQAFCHHHGRSSRSH